MPKALHRFGMTLLQRLTSLTGFLFIIFLVCLAAHEEVPELTVILFFLLGPFVLIGLTRRDIIISDQAVSGPTSHMLWIHFGKRTSFPLTRIDKKSSLRNPPWTFLAPFKRCLVRSIDGDEIYVPNYLPKKQFDELKKIIMSCEVVEA